MGERERSCERVNESRSSNISNDKTELKAMIL